MDRQVKIKENERRDKYSDLDKELRRPKNMRMTVIPVVIGTLGTVPKGLERRLKENDLRPSKLQPC